MSVVFIKDGYTILQTEDCRLHIHDNLRGCMVAHASAGEFLDPDELEEALDCYLQERRSKQCPHPAR